MICKVYRHWRKIDGKRVRDRLYTGHLKIKNDLKVTYIPLGIADKEAAQRKLDEIRQEREQEAAGILTPKPIRQAAQTPLPAHLAAFTADLIAKQRNAEYVDSIRHRCTALFTACGWKILRDITPESFIAWRAEQAMAPKTLNEYLNAATGFLNWMENNGSVSHNPLSKVDHVETKGNEVRKRRALTMEQLESLLKASPKRALIYLTKVYTGLRRNELGLLTWGDLHLDGTEPFVKVRASTTKNKKQASLPLRRELARMLLAARPAHFSFGTPVFPQGMPKMETFRLDLQAAGIPYKDDLGQQLDFHALRVTLATNLGRAGVSPWIGRDILRHSDIRLTTATYTDASQLPTRAAMDSLPWPSCTQIRTQIADVSRQGGASAGTVGEMVPLLEAPKKEAVSQDLATAGTSCQTKEKVAGLGFEPRKFRL